MRDDVNNTFMNVDEFADMHTVDGKEIPVLVDDNEIIKGLWIVYLVYLKDTHQITNKEHIELFKEF